ncbi:MAG: DUF971 domain-containing protein [Pseudomonadota bacterium]
MQTAPTDIVYHRRSRELEVVFADASIRLSAEYLRVYSPSAEVRGHGPEERKLVTGKKHVAISGIEAVGNYAIRITFDDGHDTGLYAWEYLRELDAEREQYWGEYMKELRAANASRLQQIPVGNWSPRG